MRRNPLPAGLLGCVVFAVWALALAIAAWMGLGSRLPLADGVGEQRPLPQVPALAAERLGALSQYPQVVSRPLFNEGRRPQPYYIGGNAEEPAGSLRLSGVLITPRLSMATLSGEGGLSLRLQLGGPAVQGWQLLELSERQATVLGPSGSQILPLAVYAGDGTAAAPATASGVPAETATVARGNPGPLPVPSPAPSQPGAPAAAAASTPAATTAANEPSAAQMQAIRARIQARREQMRQNNNGQQAGQNR